MLCPVFNFSSNVQNLMSGSWGYGFTKVLVYSYCFPDAANAKFIAQKSKGMPLTQISLAKLQNTAASDAMSEISFGLFKAYKSMQGSVSQGSFCMFK